MRQLWVIEPLLCDCPERLASTQYNATNPNAKEEENKRKLRRHFASGKWG
jgi:hypothetical protein